MNHEPLPFSEEVHGRVMTYTFIGAAAGGRILLKEFDKGTCVVYGTNGLCMVEDIKEIQFTVGAEKNTYYVLKPVGANAATIFVPVDNEKLMSEMRATMTKEEIDSLLCGMTDKEIRWDNDRKRRLERFHDILFKGVTEELLLMINCIYRKKQELSAINKQIPTSDSNTLKSAEKLVEEEFSHVLGIEPSEVGKYIRNVLGVPETDE